VKYVKIGSFIAGMLYAVKRVSVLMRGVLAEPLKPQKNPMLEVRSDAKGKG